MDPNDQPAGPDGPDKEKMEQASLGLTTGAAAVIFVLANASR